MDDDLRTKIVCTLGPSTSSRELVEELVRGGMDVARVNMSHGDRAQHRRLTAWVREAADAASRPVGLLVDLQGPKLRVGTLPEAVPLEEDDVVVLAPEGSVASGEIPTTYPELARDMGPGGRVLLDDGLLELVVTDVDGERVRARVVRGGLLKSRKGMNLPGVRVSAPALTEKDLEDLEFAVEAGADFVGLSFVRRPDDIRELKSRLGTGPLAVAKIEKAVALEKLEEILAEADAVMVARGDLGVELPFEQVPLAQKRIIQMANFYGRPVITATQMLESMMTHPRPTRAEASDVANAILDGTDAVMLSGETATGAYPLEALEAMSVITREIEESGVLEQGPQYQVGQDGRLREGATPREHAIASATVEAAALVGAPAIMTHTRTGGTPRLVSSYRPDVPIFGVCTDERTYRQLAVVWGVVPVHAGGSEVSYDALLDAGRDAILRRGVGADDDPVVVTAGSPFHTAGTTNMLKIESL